MAPAGCESPQATAGESAAGVAGVGEGSGAGDGKETREGRGERGGWSGRGGGACKKGIACSPLDVSGVDGEALALGRGDDVGGGRRAAQHLACAKELALGGVGGAARLHSPF